MEFLKDIASPQSLEHYRLVVLITAISSMIFLPYIGFVLGSSLFSFRLRSYSEKLSDKQASLSSYNIIELPLKTKSVIMFLGIIPGASLVFSFAQLLQSSPSISVTLSGFGFVCVLVGLWFLYSYKESLRIQEMIKSYEDVLKTQKVKTDINNEKRFNLKGALSTSGRYNLYGIGSLLMGTFLYSSAFALTANPSSWLESDSIFTALISLSVWVKFIATLVLSVGITGFGILFFAHSKISIENEFAAITRETCVKLAMVALFVLPIMLLADVVSISESAMSGLIYTFTGCALILFFLAAHFLYGYRHSESRKSIAIGFFVFLLAAGIFVAKDSIAIGTATREHAAVLSMKHEISINELKTSLGVSMVTFTGEDIYNAKCSSCHLFDKKKVGPAYQETVPKYEGNKKELITFILNPVKKNPDYPPMINPGVKPAEADSVASYIIRRIVLLKLETSK
jgi:cytochrome c